MNFDFIRSKVVQFLVGKIGSAAAPLISTAVSLALAKFYTVVPGAESLIDPKSVVAVVWVICMSGINYATNHWLTKDAKTIQQALVKVGAKLDIDGYVGDQTVRAFEEQTGIEVRRAVAVETPDPR